MNRCRMSGNRRKADITRLWAVRKEPAKNSDRFQASQTTQAAEASQPKLFAHGENENSLI
jgi:hypothetical protein